VGDFLEGVSQQQMSRVPAANITALAAAEAKKRRVHHLLQRATAANINRLKVAGGTNRRGRCTGDARNPYSSRYHLAICIC